MGYGSRALQLLKLYYEGRFVNMNNDVNAMETDAPTDAQADDEQSEDLRKEKIVPRKRLPPLLLKLSERPPERLHYLGVSYGITPQLFGFWKRAGYVPVYIRLTPVRSTT